MIYSAISLIVFACVFGGAVFGMVLRTVLPQHHLSDDSKDVVKLAMAVVATTSALVLGLLISSAKSSFDAQTTELTEVSAKIIMLDRALAHYGPEALGVRALLRSAVAGAIDRMSSKEPLSSSMSTPSANELLYDKIQELSPKNDLQRSLQAQALSTATSIGEARWLMSEQMSNTVSVPLLIVLTLWLTMIFTSFGLFAPYNATVVANLFMASFAVSAAVLLILELHSPYGGLIRISSAPLRSALTHLGR